MIPLLSLAMFGEMQHQGLALTMPSPWSRHSRNLQAGIKAFLQKKALNRKDCKTASR